MMPWTLNRQRLSLIVILLGVATVGWSFPLLDDNVLAANIGMIGGGVLVLLAYLLARNNEWAQDILTIASVLMALLSLTTLLSGFSGQWILLTLISLYLAIALLHVRKS